MTPVTMLTLLSSEDNDDEHYGSGDDNIDDNVNQILVPGSKNNYEDDLRVSRRQQVCCFKLNKIKNMEYSFSQPIRFNVIQLLKS